MKILLLEQDDLHAAGYRCMLNDMGGPQVSRLRGAPDAKGLEGVDGVVLACAASNDSLPAQLAMVRQAAGRELPALICAEGLDPMGLMDLVMIPASEFLPLPFTREQFHEAAARAFPGLSCPQRNEPATHDHALIVDDDKAVRELLAAMLKRLGVQHVVEAPDGWEALRHLVGGAGRFGLVLLDLSMPGFSGQEFLRERRKNAGFRDIPTLVVTGDGTAETRLQIRELGAQGFLIKPLQFAVFEHVVRSTPHFRTLCGQALKAG